jgi:hypothetical protein
MATSWNEASLREVSKMLSELNPNMADSELYVIMRNLTNSYLSIYIDKDTAFMNKCEDNTLSADIMRTKYNELVEKHNRFVDRMYRVADGHFRTMLMISEWYTKQTDKLVNAMKEVNENKRKLNETLTKYNELLDRYNKLEILNEVMSKIINDNKDRIRPITL